MDESAKTIEEDTVSAAHEPSPVPAARSSRRLVDPVAESVARSSQRFRLIPPDGRAAGWWVRHRTKVHVVEWGLSFAFFCLAGHYLWLLLFPPIREIETVQAVPSREEFRERLRMYKPVEARPEWAVDARMGRWRSIVIHHSATDSGNPESFDKYHREVRRWENGLGYHFVIGNGKGMGNGEIAIGSRWIEQLDGAHVKGRAGENANSYSIGVCLVGNFNVTLPTPEQCAALKGLLAFLRREYGIGLASIVGHSAVSVEHTDCPGNYFFVDEVALALANP